VVIAQPSGRVTLVFTDIEGSTRLLRELGEKGYRQELDSHRSCVREAFGRNEGYEAGCEGDSFFYAFASAEAALSAAREAIAGLQSSRVRIRVGVHTGEPGLDPPNYVGLDVHKAARVMAAGHGGQVLLSQATRELVGDGVPLRYLGEYRLKDIPRPERLYQLGADEFPPLRTLYHTNLPTPASPFVGRDEELSDVVAVVRGGAPLVTLAGPGGSGKTRLALHVASALSEEFPDGVWWLPLASLGNHALVLTELARVLGIEESELGDALGGKRLLITLDNAEHLLPAVAAPLAFLRDLAGPTLLVTSRERLHLSGEHVYQVPPLTAEDGYLLFELRAQAIDPAFRAGPEVEQLCSHLDELPLAIELAAAQTTALSPEQILRRLSQRLDLVAAARDVDPRQRTLRATIEWSHGRLSADEAKLFARLAVFAGGWALESAEDICGATHQTLAALVDKSLVRRSGERFWLLETIREYASEQLHASGELQQLELRHASFYARYAERAWEGMRGSSVRSWLDRLEQELPNLRTSLSFLLDSGDAPAALRLSTRLRTFWAARSPTEGSEWLERTLASGAGTPAERGEGFVAAASLAGMHGHPERAVAFAHEAIEAARRAGDGTSLATACGFCGWTLAELGDLREATEMLECTRELVPSVHDLSARAEALRYVALILSHTGDPGEALRIQWEVVRAYRELGSEMGLAYALNGIGYMTSLNRDYDQANAALEESLEISRRLRLSVVRMALGQLGLVAVFEGRYRDALPLLSEDLHLAAAINDRRRGAVAVLGLAAAYAGLGQYELAATLEAIAKAEYQAAGLPGSDEVDDRLEPLLREAREQASYLAVRGTPLTMATAIRELERRESETTSPWPPSGRQARDSLRPVEHRHS
jgi:predicted ATPase